MSKVFNYENVTSSRNRLVSNRDTMNDLFNKYQTELQKIDAAWMGQSGNASKEEMNYLIGKYNGFLSKVNDFILQLEQAQTTFIEAESTNSTRYNNL